MGKEVEIMLDDDAIMNETPMHEVTKSPVKQTNKKQIKQSVNIDEPIINCLRNERIIVKHVPKETGIVRDPKHILYGGMA